ncbi:hypothetical protein AMS68_007772 [Peltaster fructicola]|uniref:Major facilitator superfamily (MFS) profile domain-containing protein n=1 Tax=Peltaster fructicola TaxID=286661 RepID=A0A6H0Y5T2_9PEZI|nr:hypothetical protein AMS68_007772 [Peltaster fructicola]
MATVGKDGYSKSDEVLPAEYDKNVHSGAIGGVHPDELEGLTVFEKKCVLINHEIDRNGMGRYQWYIWTLCGFGYLLDLLWAQAFGLVLSPLAQELNLTDVGNISVSFSAGLTAGAAFWGILVDFIGRQWAFNLTCLISAAFGLGLGGCNTSEAFLVLTAFVGFGIGGNIPIDTTICLEFIPQNRRFLLALLSIFQPIGVVITTAIAYGFIPKYSCTPNWTAGKDALPSCFTTAPGQDCCGKSNNMGWRYLMFTLGAITLGVFILRFVVFRFKESPKFLVFRGFDSKAIGVLEHIAHTNGRTCGLTLADFDALTSEAESLNSATALIGTGTKQRSLSAWQSIKFELGRYKLLFANFTMTRLTILVWLTYICDFWGFTLAGTFLPTILTIKNANVSVDLLTSYRDLIAIYAPGIVAVVIGTMMYGVPSVGRKWTMVISVGLMGASIFIYSTVNDRASNIGLNMMEYFFQSMFNAVLYGWTPEAFPSPIRGTACGVASFWGRLFGIIAPLTVDAIVPTNSSLETPRSQQDSLHCWRRNVGLCGLGFIAAKQACRQAEFLRVCKMQGHNCRQWCPSRS